MRTRRLTTAYAAGLAAVVALAGCGNGGEGTAAPASPGVATGGSASTASVTAAPSATTTVAEDPVLARIPAEARPETREGAEAFARFFIGQVNRAWSGPEAEAMEGLFSYGCKGCVAFSESAEAMEMEGRHHGADTLTVTGGSVISLVEGTSEVRLDITQNAVPVLDINGDRLRTSTRDQGSFVLTLRFADHWIVERLQVVKQ